MYAQPHTDVLVLVFVVVLDLGREVGAAFADSEPLHPSDGPGCPRPGLKGLDQAGFGPRPIARGIH